MKLRRTVASLIWFMVIILPCCTWHQKKPSSLPQKTNKEEANILKEDSIPDWEEEVTSIIKAAEEYYATGEVAYQSGHMEKARQFFDKSIDTILNAGINLAEREKLKDKYLQLIDEIYAKEMEWLQQGDGFTDVGSEPALIDELGEINLNNETPEIESSAEEIESSSKELHFDLPVVINEKVLAFVELFKTERRKEIEAGLQRSGRYLHMIKNIFRQEGLPEDLAYMALVESGYKPHALSRAWAKGIWQFIKSTGNKYGLKVNWWLDERSDPEKATRAAARHIKDLYELFGDWHLVMAGYNGGENRIKRAIDRLKTKDFWRIAKTRYIRRETKNYVPAVLAAILISKDPTAFGFDIEKEEPIKYDKVNLKRATDLRLIAQCCQTSLKEIIDLNPELRRLMTPVGYTNYEIRIPAGAKERFLKEISSIPESRRISLRRHIVRTGESLSQIAMRYRTSISAICQANNIRNKHRIRAGSSLIIPVGPISGRYYPVWKPAKVKYARAYKKDEQILYRVKRGDSLYKISLRYGTNVESIKKWNNLHSDKLFPGKKLVLWAGTVLSNSKSILKKSRDKGTIIYQVKLGDTLYDIAKEFNTSVKALCRWNGLSAKKKIFPGDRLTIYLNR